MTGRRGGSIVDAASPVVRFNMALLMSLLSPEAKEGCAPLGMGWLWDLRDWMRASKEGESSGWVFEVEALEECGGLIMGSQVLQNQPGSESA